MTPVRSGQSLAGDRRLLEASQVHIEPEHPLDCAADLGDASLARGPAAPSHLDAGLATWLLADDGRQRDGVGHEPLLQVVPSQASMVSCGLRQGSKTARSR